MRYKKQHPYFLLKEIVSSVKEFILALLVLISAVFAKGRNGKILFLIIALIVIAIIVFTIIIWKNNVYSFDETGMHLNEGLIERKSRYIPSDKIHTMDMDSNLIQRLFGVVTIRIDTASGGKEAEVCLILSENEAEHIKKVLLNDSIKQNDQEEKTEIQEKYQEFSNENIQYKATIMDLIITAITSKYIMGGIFFIFVAYDKINDVMPENIKTRFNDFESKSTETIMAYKSIKIVIALILVVLIVTFIISIISTVIKYYDFTVSRDKNKINITYGLLNKKSVVIPIHRIQSISIVEGILKKPFNAVTINVESIGYGKEKGESTMLFPLLNKNKIDKFFKEVLTETMPEFEFDHSSKKSLIGYLMRNGLISLIIGSFSTYKFKYGFLILMFVPLFFLLGYYKYKDAGISMEESKLIMQYRVLAKYIVIIPKKNIQSTTKSQSIFQRRNNLINIKAAIQGEIAQTEYIIRGMDNSEFTKLQRWLFSK